MIAQFLKNVILTAISAASVAAGISPQPDALPRKPALGTQFEQGTTKVSRVIAGSSAEGALKVGDEITMIGNQKVENAPSLVQILNGCLSGRDYVFTVKREGKEELVTVHLKERAREVSDKYDVIYDHVVSNGNKIRTIVTKPKKEGRFPVFMMMQGLGEFSMDYDLSRGGAYSQFVSHFANKDFVTIRVEKPGMGDSEGGPYVETDFWTEGDVYRQALKAVKQYPFVDPDQVFIYGHSMGGLYGPVIVGEQPIAGFIAASTVYKTWTEYWLENVRRQNVLGGMSRVAVDQDEKDLALMSAWILTEKRDPQELIKLFPRLETKVNQMVVDGKFLGRTIDFWTQLAGMNYAENWSKVTSPTLVLWGQWDFVSTEEDHHMIVKALNAKTPGLAEYVRIDNANHGFTECTSYEDAFASFRVARPFRTEIITVIDQWIEKTRKIRKNAEPGTPSPQ